MTKLIELKRRATGESVWINTDSIVTIEHSNVRRSSIVQTTGERIEVLEKVEEVIERLDQLLSDYTVVPVSAGIDTQTADNNLAEITARLAAVEKALEPSTEPPAENAELKAILDRLEKIEVAKIDVTPGPIITLPADFDAEAMLKRLADVEDLLTTKPAEAPAATEPAPAADAGQSSAPAPEAKPAKTGKAK